MQAWPGPPRSLAWMTARPGPALPACRSLSTPPVVGFLPPSLFRCETVVELVVLLVMGRAGDEDGQAGCAPLLTTLPARPAGHARAEGELAVGAWC